MYLLIGLFSAQKNKQVRVFTDVPEPFLAKLGGDSGGGLGKLMRQNVHMHRCGEVQDFSVDEAENMWHTFDNQEALSQYEML